MRKVMTHDWYETKKVSNDLYLIREKYVAKCCAVTSGSSKAATGISLSIPEWDYRL